MYYGHSFADTASSAILVLRIICSTDEGLSTNKLTYGGKCVTIGVGLDDDMSNGCSPRIQLSYRRTLRTMLYRYMENTIGKGTKAICEVAPHKKRIPQLLYGTSRYSCFEKD